MFNKQTHNKCNSLRIRYKPVGEKKAEKYIFNKIDIFDPKRAKFAALFVY